jgi:hypothetical protein
LVSPSGFWVEPHTCPPVVQTVVRQPVAPTAAIVPQTSPIDKLNQSETVFGGEPANKKQALSVATSVQQSTHAQQQSRPRRSTPQAKLYHLNSERKRRQRIQSLFDQLKDSLGLVGDVSKIDVLAGALERVNSLPLCKQCASMDQQQQPGEWQGQRKGTNSGSGNTSSSNGSQDDQHRPRGDRDGSTESDSIQEATSLVNDGREFVEQVRS